MSSYTQLLSNYLANSNKPHSVSKPEIRTQTNPYFTTTNGLKTETAGQQRDSSRYILDKYGPLSKVNDSRDLFSKERSLLGSFEIKNTENSRISGFSEGFSKPSYNTDILKKQAKTLKEPIYLQGNQRGNDLLWDLSLESPSIEITKKKHEENINTALTDLLNYKPFKNTQSSLEKVDKIEGYSNILKEIDQCVTDMRKFSARTTVATQPEDHSSKASYTKSKLRNELSSEPLRKKIQNDDRLASNPISTINFKSQETDFIHNASEFLSKQQDAAKPAYQINHFLPEKRLLKVESSSERQQKKEHFPQKSHEVSRDIKPRENEVISIKQNERYSIDNTSPEYQDVQEDIENKQEFYASEKTGREEENNIYELVERTLRKEKLLKNNDKLIESLSKTLAELINDYSNEKITEKVAEIESLKRIALNIEKLEPFNFIPVETPPKELQSSETQTDNESGTPIFNKELPDFSNGQTLSQQVLESVPVSKVIENKKKPAEIIIENGNDNPVAVEEVKPQQTPSNKPSSHMYTLSFSVKKDENFVLPTTNNNNNNVHEFNIKEYLPKFESVSEFDQNQEEQKEESPSFLKTEDVSRQENLYSKFSDRKSSLPENVLKDNLNEPLTGDNISKSAFARSKGSCHSERGSTKIINDQANRSGGRWNEFSPNFFFAENDGKIQPRIGQHERSISRSPGNNSSFKNSRGFNKDNEIQLAHRSATNLFSSDLKNKAEKSFLNKIQSTQHSFNSFLKQKIDEIQEGNKKFENKKDSVRSITPSRLNSITGSSNFSQTKERSIPRLPMGAKDPKIPPKSFKKEDKLLEFPRKSSHQELGSFKNTMLEKGKWLETNFQEESQVDKIIKSFF